MFGFMKEKYWLGTQTRQGQEFGTAMLVCFNLGIYLLDVKEENIEVITKSGRFLFVYFDKYVLLSFRNDSFILWYNELKQAAPACFL